MKYIIFILILLFFFFKNKFLKKNITVYYTKYNNEKFQIKIIIKIHIL